MAIDIKNLNSKQLADLERQVAARKNEVRKDAIAEVREKVNKLVKSSGFTMDEVFPGRGRRTAVRRRVAPKYRDPADPGRTWSGRGKRPNWFKEAVAKGKKEKDLLIK
ncbi:MAG TPA: H-NS histone family protein [Rhodanobacteraceae bacterium]|nr:H-NS histone family protein [Rhodanobacteraceae bacterium]